jgi:hypothetical protein
VKEQTLSLPVRVAVLLTLPFLAACEYSFGVQRHAALPAGVEFPELESVSVREPGYSAADSRLEDDYCLVSDGDAHASASFDGRRISVASIWTGRRPSDAVLERSIEIQRELIRRMRLALPALRSEESWEIEWVRMEAPTGRRS